MILLILGMHRSGTSLLSGMLHNSGVYMGESFRPASHENPKGFFEEEAFRQLNDEVLSTSGYSVKGWSCLFDSLTFSDFHLERATELVRESHGSHADWGWKDPRNCLTLPLWVAALRTLDLIDETKILSISRQEDAVARSLFRRGNVSSLTHGRLLRSMYQDAAEKSLRELELGHHSITLTYEGLLSGSDIPRLEEFCHITLNRDLVDPSLNRSER